MEDCKGCKKLRAGINGAHSDECVRNVEQSLSEDDGWAGKMEKPMERMLKHCDKTGGEGPEARTGDGPETRIGGRPQAAARGQGGHQDATEE